MKSCETCRYWLARGRKPGVPTQRWLGECTHSPLGPGGPITFANEGKHCTLYQEVAVDTNRITN